MNKSWKSPGRIASALLLSVVLAGCASEPKSSSPELQQQIEAARTRTDHAALATHYDREAARARASATEHRSMAQSYQRMGGRTAATMPAHCNALVSMYESIAAEYAGMAADHRGLAAQAQP